MLVTQVTPTVISVGTLSGIHDGKRYIAGRPIVSSDTDETIGYVVISADMTQITDFMKRSSSLFFYVAIIVLVLALAAVIMGTSLFKRVRWMKATTMAILGALIYKACLQIALQLGLPNHFLKLLMAVLLFLVLLSDRFTRKKKGGAVRHAAGN